MQLWLDIHAYTHAQAYAYIRVNINSINWKPYDDLYVCIEVWAYGIENSIVQSIWQTKLLWKLCRNSFAMPVKSGWWQWMNVCVCVRVCTVIVICVGLQFNQNCYGNSNFSLHNMCRMFNIREFAYIYLNTHAHTHTHSLSETWQASYSIQKHLKVLQ